LARRILAGDRRDLPREIANVVLDQSPFRPEPLDEQAHRWRERIASLGPQLR